MKVESAYGCIKCQRYHFECESEYQEHLLLQSKFGLRDATHHDDPSGEAVSLHSM